MVYLMGFVIFAAAATISVRSAARKETRLLASISISRPAKAVFEIIEHVGREIVWYRKSDWLPRPLRVSQLSCWHEHVPPDQRHQTAGVKTPAQVSIHLLEDCVFTYRSTHECDMDYECSFRLGMESGKCLLTWEMRYQVRRLADILARQRIVNSTADSMARSLEYIKRLALAPERSQFSRAALHRNRRGQIPAA